MQLIEKTAISTNSSQTASFFHDYSHHIEFCLAWVEGYGGRAGGLCWVNLGGNGGAGFGGKSVEFRLKVDDADPLELFAAKVEVLDADFLWNGVKVGGCWGSGCWGSSGSKGSANSDNSSIVEYTSEYAESSVEVKRLEAPENDEARETEAVELYPEDGVEVLIG